MLAKPLLAAGSIYTPACEQLLRPDSRTCIHATVLIILRLSCDSPVALVIPSTGAGTASRQTKELTLCPGG
jgi:hypothetical protein